MFLVCFFFVVVCVSFLIGGGVFVCLVWGFVCVYVCGDFGFALFSGLFVCLVRFFGGGSCFEGLSLLGFGLFCVFACLFVFK